MTADSIAELLQPYVATGPVGSNSPPEWPRIYEQLSIYLELILKWNARINLTAIRTPEEIVQRHFGESLFAGAQLGECPTLLDFGSGAGFPGLPIQLLRPDIKIALAESRHKKAAFLQEVVRSLNLPTEIWAGRVEEMPSSRRFATVALRAVDSMDAAIEEAARRAEERMLILGTRGSIYPDLSQHFPVAAEIALPGSSDGVIFNLRRS